MKTRTIIVTIIAVICGVSAMIIVAALQNRPTPNGVEYQLGTLVVAKEPISRGALITEAMLELREMPSRFAPENAILTIEECVDRVVMTPIFPDEPIIEEKLAAKGGGHGLAALIPDGMRAYTIQTTRVATNVAGFILPNNRVDVLLTMNRGGQMSSGGGGTLTLLQAAVILAVDQVIDPETGSDPEEPRGHMQGMAQSVTLLITPDQVTLLDLGQNMGTLSLSLRNSRDTTEASASPATVDMLQNLLQGLPARPVSEAEQALLAQLAMTDENSVQVVVAKERINRGTRLTEDLVEIQRRPKAFASESNVSDMADCVGRSLFISLAPGDCVLSSQLALAESGEGMEAMIPHGMRAYSIETSNVSASVAGFLVPGNFVDVLLTISEEEGEKITAPLLEAVEILAIDQRLDRPTEDEADARETQSVTLLVTQDQTLILDLGLSLGAPSLALRSPTDKEQRTNSQLTLTMLRDLHSQRTTGSQGEDDEQAEASSARSQTYMIRTLRGGFSGYVPVNVWNPEN